MPSKDLYKNTPYFKKFPFINYRGQTGINIMTRVEINANVRNFYSSFYTYTMNRDDTVDHMAYNYYKDVDFDWIIYHANDVIDPYYDVALTTNKFNLFIKKKYGSETIAKVRVKHYRTNWRDDDSIISTSAYNALGGNFNPVNNGVYENDGTNPDFAANRRKYWKEIRNQTGILGYSRNDEDIIITTNRIETYDFTTDSGTFIRGERITKDSDGTVQATFENTTSEGKVIIDDIVGNFCSNTDFTVTGFESGAVGTIKAIDEDATEEELNILSQSLVPDGGPIIRNVIPKDEQIYYSPVSFYDFEFEKNEENGELYMVDESYKNDLNQQLTELLR